MQPLEFSTPDGETFVLWPGDVVVAVIMSPKATNGA